MNTLQANNFFEEMKNSTFTFQASTRIWFGPAEKVPDEIKDDLGKVQSFIMDRQNKAAIELVFTGPISIYRGSPQAHPDTGRNFLPMQIVDMEEFGYSKELDTTIKMTAKPGTANFGYTHQLALNLDVPAEARMLMTLQFEGVHGQMAEMLSASKPAVKKELAANIQSFPFTNGNTLFQHVGDEARRIEGDDGKLFGYLAYGIMTPQYQLGDVSTTPPSKLNLLTGGGAYMKNPIINQREEDFLLNRIQVV
jgi:hypothetical protein